jgi:hypothetical protein
LGYESQPKKVSAIVEATLVSLVLRVEPLEHRPGVLTAPFALERLLEARADALEVFIEEIQELAGAAAERAADHR